jgi:ppGpp synthetase/RelA/SpoT-type nucleotidyltranferase
MRLYEGQRRQYEGFADALRVLLAQLADDAKVAVDSVTGRAKDSASLTKKLKNPKYVRLNDITDLCGLRIVTRHAEDVHVLVGLLKEEFEVLEHVVHGAASPESFGYSSEHLILRVDYRRGQLREWKAYKGLAAEVQVRSILQHAWASISHGLDYKSEGEAPVDLRRQLFRIAALLETSDELFDSFRRDMLQTRGNYETLVSRNEWEVLPLNLDSFRAAEDKFPWSRIIEKAMEAGFRVDHHNQKLNKYWLSYVGADHGLDGAASLVRVAQAIGMETLGELRSAAESLLADSGALQKVAHKAAESSNSPYPIPYDVLTFYLLVSSKSEQAFTALRQGVSFIDDLTNAAHEVAFNTDG